MPHRFRLVLGLHQWISLAILLAISTCITVFGEDSPKKKTGPAFQYASKGIEISVPTADEKKRDHFDGAGISAASLYLDQGALSWVREKTCINCHTTGPYMAERPALTQFLGKPVEEIRTSFAANVPAEIPASGKTTGGAAAAVWRTLGLAEWDRHVTKSLSPDTEQSLKDMFARQAADGRFISSGEVEIPHITTDFELTLQAARAVTSAPGWLDGLRDQVLMGQVDKMKSFLKQEAARNDYERILRLQLRTIMPELVSTEQTEAALKLLSEKQHADGGWSLRDMSSNDNWRTPMSDKVLDLLAGLPDAKSPESDPYMTAFAIVLLRQNQIGIEDSRVQRAIAWLKNEQRETGRWWMNSLYRGNYHYITYIATAQAMKAMALCGELPSNDK